MYIGKLQIEKTLHTPVSDIPQKPIIGPIKAGLSVRLIADNPNSPVFTIVSLEADLVTIKCDNLVVALDSTETSTTFSLKTNEIKTLYYQSIDGTMIYNFKALEIHEEVAAPVQSPNQPKPTNSIPNQTPAAPAPTIRMPTHYFSNIQGILSQLEQKLSSKVIVYYMSPRVSITQNDPEYFLEVLKKGEKYPKISLILHSPGGDSMASYRIANLLRQYCDELEIIVAGMASSAATNLSLAADVLKFSPLGFLSPIDTQQMGITDERLVKLGYSYISSDSYRRSKEMIDKEADKLPNGSYTELFKYIHPLVVSEVDRMSSKSKLIATKMMKMQRQPLEDSKIDQITNHLVYDYPAHGFPILMKEAQEIGLNAQPLDEESCFLIWDLFKFYSSVTKNQYTYINIENQHVEINELIIETVGKRVVRRFSYDNVFSNMEKKWLVANDNSSWKKFTPNSDPKGQPIILSIEKEEEVTPPSQP